MSDRRIDELLHRIDELERRLEERDGPRRERWDRRDSQDSRLRRDDHGRDRWPSPPPPPRRGRGGEGDEKRIVDLVVALVTERVEQIVSREIDRAIHTLKAESSDPSME